MIKGPTDTTTVGLPLPILSTLHHHPSFFLSFLLHSDRRANSRFGWVLSSFLLSFSLLLFLCPPLCLPSPSPRSIPACLCSKCTYLVLCPPPPLVLSFHGLQSLSQCHTRAEEKIRVTFHTAASHPTIGRRLNPFKDCLYCFFPPLLRVLGVAGKHKLQEIASQMELLYDHTVGWRFFFCTIIYHFGIMFVI